MDNVTVDVSERLAELYDEFVFWSGRDDLTLSDFVWNCMREGATRFLNKNKVKLPTEFSTPLEFVGVKECSFEESQQYLKRREERRAERAAIDTADSGPAETITAPLSEEEKRASRSERSKRAAATTKERKRAKKEKDDAETKARSLEALARLKNQREAREEADVEERRAARKAKEKERLASCD